jgi:hypothetical protein
MKIFRPTYLTGNEHLVPNRENVFVTEVNE